MPIYGHESNNTNVGDAAVKVCTRFPEPENISQRMSTFVNRENNIKLN